MPLDRWRRQAPGRYARPTDPGFVFIDSTSVTVNYAQPFTVTDSAFIDSTSVSVNYSVGIDNVFVDSTSVSVSYSVATAPAGPSGSWALVFTDDFEGAALDSSKWVVSNGTVRNGLTTATSNVSVANSEVRLQLASSSSGAEIVSDGYDPVANPGHYVFPVGDYVEARVWFPGNGTQIYNWSAWWTSGPNWPAAGEHDIAEVLDVQDHLTVNYHWGPGPFPAHQSTRVYTQTQYMGDAWHVFGVHRKNTSADYYWDGVLVGTVTTNDDGGANSLILNAGLSGNTMLGLPGALRCDWVRAWRSA